MAQPRSFIDDKNPISTRSLIPSDKPVTPEHVAKFVKKRNKRIKAQKEVESKMNANPGLPPKK